jgi:hypothetical protein
MFQFTNQVVINTATDSLSGAARWTGSTAALNFKRVGKFNAWANNEGILAIYLRKGTNPVKEVGSITIPTGAGNLPAGLYQLEVQVQLAQDSQNSFYSRDTPVVKGKPFYYSFEITATEAASATVGTTAAQKIIKAAQFIRTRFGETVYIDFSNSANTLTITAQDEFQRFTKIALQKYDVNPDPCATCACDDCSWQDLVLGTVTTKGASGFGTYFQILKDLRLPTAANWNWTSLNSEERPVPGVLYDQYTIKYIAKRGIQGTDAVGDLVTSATDHVLYIPNTYQTSLLGLIEALSAVGTNGAVKASGPPIVYYKYIEV